MLLRLLNLYQKSNTPTPLEDFITEAFVGLLRSNSLLLKQFVEFLNLPKGNYTVYTQKTYLLKNDSDCRIDIELREENKKIICFIENKVESKEGENQLIRYEKALSNYYQDYDKHLVYCTKYYDPKSSENDAITFRTIFWHQIYSLLSSLEIQSDMITTFNKLLKIQNMSVNGTISSYNMNSMKDLKSTLLLMNKNIESVSGDFKKYFGTDLSFRPTTTDILKFNKYFAHKKSILKNIADSNIAYGFLLREEKPSIFVHIWAKQSDHPVYNCFKTLLQSFYSDNILIRKNGIALEIKQDIASKEYSEADIAEWFKLQFEDIHQKLMSNSNVDWNIPMKVENERL